MGKGVVLGLVGSPNREGRTHALVSAALQGAAAAGAPTELVQMADHVVGACRDCQPWVCHTNLRCTYDDPNFVYLSEKILNCGALVLGTPVYWWDTSAMVRYLILKMFRVYARSSPTRGLPALGLAVAGGGGNGLISGLRPLYHFFQMMNMRAVAPVPANRFNFPAALAQARKRGKALAQMADGRASFLETDGLAPDAPPYVLGLEDKLLYYDSLPYLGMSRAEERRLVVELAVAALPEEAARDLSGRLSQAARLALNGGRREELQELTRVYEAAVRLLGR